MRGNYLRIIRLDLKTRNFFIRYNIASREGHTEVTELLIKHGSIVNDKNNMARTALHYC